VMRLSQRVVHINAEWANYLITNYRKLTDRHRIRINIFLKI